MSLDIPVYQYSKDSFIFETGWNRGDSSSNFDQELSSKWMEMQEKGYFRYKLEIDQCKTLPGQYGYLAQLNLARALLRRKPMNMQHMKQIFDHNQFNFTKMDKREIIFELMNMEKKVKGNFLSINVSPLEFGHCLFLPALYSCLSQVVTQDSLLSAVELFLLSKSPAMRMGFNGLCAYASLNHLHYHIYYLHHQMLLETVEVEHLAGPCYVLTSFPSRGFVFQLTRDQPVDTFISNVYKLVNFLQENEKPHNIFITRGSSVDASKCPNPAGRHSCVRLYVWARKPSYGEKEMSAFNPALCELFGHLNIKTKEDYELLTEEFVADVMSELTSEPYQSVVDQVREMFSTSTSEGSR